jgi:hypothetical protein
VNLANSAEHTWRIPLSAVNRALSRSQDDASAQHPTPSTTRTAVLDAIGGLLATEAFEATRAGKDKLAGDRSSHWRASVFTDPTPDPMPLERFPPPDSSVTCRHFGGGVDSACRPLVLAV